MTPGPCGTGLSPRVRGNLADGTPSSGSSGSIPACAGEPRGAGGSPRPARVYPRVCGGTRHRSAASGRPPGLSPRVRGNRGPGVVGRHVRGSIPACAGEPDLARARAGDARVYPRVCGGTPLNGGAMRPEAGLSPRVRGNRLHVGGQLSPLGSIPACAGEPSEVARLHAGGRVYPRVCGGTAPGRTSALSRPGLSPRVRGNPPRWRACTRAGGSIPACAGEPASPAGASCGGGVYPRVCGGTPSLSGLSATRAGLSPRVRGNRGLAVGPASARGSIPACAGEPRHATASPLPARVYPRVCGGTHNRD